ncbi:TPR repeat-containing protein [Geobacter metallireducens RCH3]|uniref:TPR domain protein n=1 Tax=Geobacter metallireducens (strain ATCC 53774 / DSM 7210 / GS-15) TaxID=269799 RepID=Q39V58_GEOMG|nr:tetratricopeptide repeat protein [Geobacter metallireducens]ABB31866.1 TPR domain protein [Geobacter metallireducens GS-15]EHP89250.1 TPR repeat-containing protein [Geobacter metallireducens RCH3]
MSPKKDKFLDNAQKFLVKGQLDRALREYEQAVAIDPKDVRVRQKYAELLVRANRKDDALKEFEVIGKYYSDNGFYLKAIAVYKQIQKLTPSNLDISLTLGALNEKQGLIGNALAEYKFVFDHYERSNRFIDAVAVLEKMLAADRDNLNIRLKLAETRHRANLIDDAYHDYTELARELRSKGDNAAYTRVCERIASMFPDRKDFLLTVAENQIRDGKAAAAIPVLKQIVGDDRWNPKALYLLADAARAVADPAMVKGAYGQIIKRFPGEITAIKGFLFSLKAEGNVDEAVRVLRHVEPELIKAEPETLEQFYLSFRDLSPDHPGIAEGLLRIRGTAGVDEPEPMVEQVPDVAEPEKEADFAPQPEESDSVMEEPPAEDIPWEEEIDISFDSDGASVEGNRPTEGEASESPSFLHDEGMSLVEADESPIRFDDSSEEETREVEVELADFSSITPDWLDGVPDSAMDKPGETTFSEGLSLDFTDGELEDVIPPPPLDSPMPKPDKYGLDGLFSAFKKGVGEQLTQDDTESHYSLGIAYKEMGLFDDAIVEFQSAARDPRRLADCITLQGICSREKGDPAKAEEYFRSGLAVEGLNREERLCLTYELALLYEMIGDRTRALAGYREALALNPGFRDVAQKIAILRSDGDTHDAADLELLDLDEVEEGAG